MRQVQALGLVGAALVVGFAVRTVLLGGVDERGVMLAVGAAAVLVLYAALDRDEGDVAARSRSLRLGGSAALLSVAAALVAVLGYAAVRRVDTTFDLTRDARHGLTPHTQGVLAGLDVDVEILAFFPDGSPLQARFEALARRYVEGSPRLKLELVDPLRQPLRARELDVRFEAGEVVLRAGERTDRIVGRFDEDALTDALLRVTATRDQVICWTEGHGEADPDDAASPAGMGTFVLQLESQSWQVQPVSLSTGHVDGACDVLLVANPRADFLAYEQAALASWILGGGRALVLLEPGLVPGLAASLARFGLAVGDDIVLDPDPAHRPMGVEDPSVLVIPPDAMRDHPVTAGLLGALTLGIARSVVPIPDTPGIAARSLVRAGDASWGERDLTDAAETFEADDDERQGEVPLASLAEVVDPLEVPPPGDVTPAVPIGEVDALVRRTLGQALPGALTLPDTTQLDADLGLDADGVRVVVRALGQTLGVDLGVVPGETLGGLVGRAHGALAGRLPAAQGAAVPVHAGGRLIVVGDAGFAANRTVTMGSNRDFLANALAWLVGEEDQLGARPDDLGDVLDLTARDEAILALLALLVAPGLTALIAWRVRRARRGR